jgi:hypothetical protein
MTNTYNIHIYRKIRLTFEGIEAQTPEAAVRIARDGLTSDADDVDEDGEDLSALLRIDGDHRLAKRTVLSISKLRAIAVNRWRHLRMKA